MIITEYKLRRIIRKIISEASPAADRTAHMRKKLGSDFDPKHDIIDKDDSKFVADLIAKRERKRVPPHWMNWHIGSGSGMIGDPLNLKQEMIILSAINAAKEYCRKNKSTIKSGRNLKKESELNWPYFDARREKTPVRLSLTVGSKASINDSYEKLLEDNGFYKCEIRVAGFAFSDIYKDTKLETFKEDYYKRYYKRMLKKDFKEDLFDSSTFEYNGLPFTHYTSGKAGPRFKNEPTYEQAFPNRPDRSWARDHDYDWVEQFDIDLGPLGDGKKGKTKFKLKLKNTPKEQEEYIRGVYDEEYGKYDDSKDDQQLPLPGVNPDQIPSLEDLEDPKKYTQPPQKGKEIPILPSKKEDPTITDKARDENKRDQMRNRGKFGKLVGPQSRLGDVDQPSLYQVHFFLNPNCYVDDRPLGPKIAFPKIKLLTRNDMAADVPNDLHSVEHKTYIAHDIRNTGHDERAKNYAVERKKDSARGKRIKQAKAKKKKK